MAVPNYLNVFLLVRVLLVQRTGALLYGGLGGEITLTPTISGKPSDILWKHNTNKVVEYDGKENVEFDRYKGRTVLDLHNGELTIKGLTEADSGSYDLEALINNKLQYYRHEVKIIDAVAQPSVTCVVNDTGTTLRCLADLHRLTQFTWRSPAGPERPGSELFLPENEDQQSVYTCVVKNPVSEKNTEFTLKDCHTEEGSSVILAVLLSIIFILMVIFVLALWWYCWKHKKEKTPVVETQLGTEFGSTSHCYEEDRLLDNNRDAAAEEIPSSGHAKDLRMIFEAKSKIKSSSFGRQMNYNNNTTKAKNESSLDRELNLHPNTETVSEAEDTKSTPHLPSCRIKPPDEDNLGSESKIPAGEEDKTTTGPYQIPKQSKVDQSVHGKPESEDPKRDSQSGVQTQEVNQAEPEMGDEEMSLPRTNLNNPKLYCEMDDSGDDIQKREAVWSSLNTSLEPKLSLRPASELTSADSNAKDHPLDQNVKGKNPQKPKRAEKEEHTSEDRIDMTGKTGTTWLNSSMHKDTKLQDNDDKPTNKELVQETCIPVQPQYSAVDDGQLAVGAEKSEVEGEVGKGYVNARAKEIDAMADNKSNSSADRQINLHNNLSEDEDTKSTPHLPSCHIKPADEGKLGSESEIPAGEEDNTTTGPYQIPKQSKVDLEPNPPLPPTSEPSLTQPVHPMSENKDNIVPQTSSDSTPPDHDTPPHHDDTPPDHDTPPHHDDTPPNHDTPPHHDDTPPNHDTPPHHDDTLPDHDTPPHHDDTPPNHDTPPHHDDTPPDHDTPPHHDDTPPDHDTPPHHDDTPPEHDTPPHHNDNAGATREGQEKHPTSHQDLNTEHVDENQPEPQTQGSNHENQPGFLIENPIQQTLDSQNSSNYSGEDSNE